MREAVAIRNALYLMARRCELEPRVDGPPVRQGASEIWGAMVFCILSSQVRASTAQKLTGAVLEQLSFFEKWPTYSEVLSGVPIAMAKVERQHRFPKSKAKQIGMSWSCFSQIYNIFSDFVYSNKISCDRKRMFIIENFPGLGMKQSSMLLRDIGASSNIAIIDSHIMHYLNIAYDFNPRYLNRKTYLDGEVLLVREASAMGVDLAEYDHWLWSAVRRVRERGFA